MIVFLLLFNFFSFFFFFFNDTATTEIYTLSLHDALPIDSKWPGVEIAARLEEELDPAARDELRRRVEKVVCGRLREVAGYVDASLTAPLAVMAVPDAVYACCRKAHRVAKDARVLI